MSTPSPSPAPRSGDRSPLSAQLQRSPLPPLSRPDASSTHVRMNENHQLVASPLSLPIQDFKNRDSMNQFFKPKLKDFELEQFIYCDFDSNHSLKICIFVTRSRSFLPSHFALSSSCLYCQSVNVTRPRARSRVESPT